jgi:phosphatidate cytidylyltransferase
MRSSTPATPNSRTEPYTQGIVKQRVLTALVLAPAVLGALLWPTALPLSIFAVVVAILAGNEIFLMLGGDGKNTPLLLFAIVALVCVGGGMIAVPPAGVIGMTFLTAFGAVCVWSGSTGKLPPAFSAGMGLLWACAPMGAMIAIEREYAGGAWFEARNPLFIIFLSIWAGDIAAIAVGSTIGKHPMAPKISPKKTWEGAFANFLACSWVAAGTAYYIGMPVALGVACGVVGGIIGQLGDLFESFIKRRSGMKDSGTLLPGHGGIMDRVDSLLFAAPVMGCLIAVWR